MYDTGYHQPLMRYVRLKNLREDNDLTQTQLAARLQCSQRVYSDYERGKVGIPTEILIRLAIYAKSPMLMHQAFCVLERV